MLKNENTIFNIASEDEFSELSLRVFRFQQQNNPVYRRWTELAGIDVAAVNAPEKIPFLPIELFKSQQVVSSPVRAQTVCFTSSSTTSQVPAKHYVNNIALYEASFMHGFRRFYGEPSAYCILALLPGYLERSGSSLVYMCDRLIAESGHPLSGFFLHDTERLIENIEQLKRSGQRTLLIGVSYALMDLADRGIALDGNFTVMETGGMKGTRKEMLKPELHGYLQKGFRINTIHSEYGMTELLSQAYSNGGGIFRLPPWMRVLTREVDDPLSLQAVGRTGGISVIDLANLHSCSFIATKDLGRLHQDGSFEIMGRYDHSDVRGCNLMLGGF